MGAVEMDCDAAQTYEDLVQEHLVNKVGSKINK